MESNIRNLIKNATIPVYSRSNIELLLGGARRTLDSRISSLIAQGVLLPVKKGLYVNKYLYDSAPDKESFLEYVGSVLVYPSYLSLEYILSKNGLLAESVNVFTYVTTKKTRRFETDLGAFTYKSIKDGLFSNYNEQTYKGLKYCVATTAKALFDLIYFTPVQNSLELKTFLLDSRFNWDALSPQDKENLKKAIVEAQSSKMLKVLTILKKERIIWF